MPCESGPTCGDNYKPEADAATRAACDLRTVLRQRGSEYDLTPETRLWIAQHDKEDAARIEAEIKADTRRKAKQAALDKLSLEERRLLGI